MVIMNDLEWPLLSYYVIYYEKFKKVMQRTEKEALIQWHMCVSIDLCTQYTTTKTITTLGAMYI